MSFAINSFGGPRRTYTAGVITPPLVRQLLRKIRKQHFASQVTAAAEAGIDKSTVAKLENQKLFPDYDPGIGIVLSVLRVTPVSFAEFAQQLQAFDEAFQRAAAQETSAGSASPANRLTANVSELPKSDLQAAHKLATKTPRASNPGSVVDGGQVPAHADLQRLIDRTVGNALVAIGTQLIKPSADPPAERPARTPRKTKPRPRGHGARHRRSRSA